MQITAFSALIYLLSIYLKLMSLSNRNLPTFPHSQLVSWFLIKGIPSILRFTPMEKAWFYEKLFSEVVMVMVKDKKIHKRYNFNQNKFYALLSYMMWTRVMLPIVFRELKVVQLYFFTLFSVSLSLSIGKQSTLGKIWGAAAPQPPGFYDVPVEKLISSCLADFGYTDHQYLFKKYRLINDLSFE